MANEKERAQPAPPPAKSHEASGEERRTPGRQAADVRTLPLEGPDALNQLREILVGAAVRDLERRMARVEAHMTARSNELEGEGRRRMEVIESHLRRESDALTARLEREIVQTNEAIRAVSREQRESSAAGDQRAAKLEESLVRAQRDLRDQLLQQTKRFLDELLRLRREVTETLERELGVAEAGFEPRTYGEEGRASP